MVETYLEPFQTSKIEFFVKLVNGFQSLLSYSITSSGPFVLCMMCNHIQMLCWILYFLIKYLRMSVISVYVRSVRSDFLIYVRSVRSDFLRLFLSVSTTTAEVFARTCSIKQILLKILQNSHENTCEGVCTPATLLEGDSNAVAFLKIFQKLLRPPILQNTSR